MHKAQNQFFYHLRDEQDGISRRAARSITFKEYANPTLQASDLYSKVGESLMMEAPLVMRMETGRKILR